MKIKTISARSTTSENESEQYRLLRCMHAMAGQMAVNKIGGNCLKPQHLKITF